jgi:hypothetical protein
VDWGLRDSMGGSVLLMVVGVAVWLEWGSCVVVAIVGWGSWGRPVEGWLLGVGLSNVAVVRCRMCCVIAIVGGGFIPALSCGVVRWMWVGSLVVGVWLELWSVGGGVVCLDGGFVGGLGLVGSRRFAVSWGGRLVLVPLWVALVGVLVVVGQPGMRVCCRNGRGGGSGVERTRGQVGAVWSSGFGWVRNLSSVIWWRMGGVGCLVWPVGRLGCAVGSCW